MLSDEMVAKIEAYVEGMSQVRMGLYGGYPNDWQIASIDGTDSLIMASLDHDGAPELTIEPVADVIARYEQELRDEGEQNL